MTEPVVEPVFFDRHEPEYSDFMTPAEKCVRGQPLQRTWHHFTSSDEKFFAGIWEAEPGCWQIQYTENEYCRILDGESILRDNAGTEYRLRPGDDFVIPAGFEGEWEVLATTRKIYAIYEP